MRKFLPIGLIAFVYIVSSNIQAKAHSRAKTLRLIQTIPMPNVKGRIDHMDVDIKGKRLFVAGLENSTVEVVDLKAGKWMRSISGIKTPQGIAYVPALNKLFVANENDDSLKVFRGDTLVLLNTIPLELGSNPPRMTRRRLQSWYSNPSREKSPSFAIHHIIFRAN